MKKIFLAGLLVLLSGCGILGSKEVVYVCTHESGDPLVSVTETLYARGDNLTRSEEVYVVDYSPELAEGYTDQDVIDEHDRRKGVYADYESVTYQYTYESPIVTETIAVNYEDADFAELVELQYLESADITYVSLDMTLESYASINSVCVLQEG